MDKLFLFVKGLPFSFFDVLGYPIVEFHDGYQKLTFKTSNVLRDFRFFDLPFDNCCIYAEDGFLFITFWFYDSKISSDYGNKSI